MNELLKRVLFAVPAGIFFLSVMWYESWTFDLTIIAIGLFTQFEMVKLLKKAGTPTDLIFSLVIGLYIMLFPYLPFAFETGLGLFLIFVAVQTFNTKPGAFNNLTSGFFAGIYAPLGFLCLMLIRGFGTNEQGFALALSLVLMIWGGDVFAYFGGKNFGKTPLAPEISPKKTVEGFLFGFVGCTVGLAVSIYALPFVSPITMLNGLPLIFLIGIFGPIGDLIESKIKRKAEVKDSSNLLPGHGGFFDRFDALIPASCAMYIYLIFMQEFGYVTL
ncbi:MAG: phosphatidate cytidylyltransferase [Balneola sp.]|nr:phosphatidate cytidylyltransferase [Balneola sp.]